jgi:hypothetical protein
VSARRAEQERAGASVSTGDAEFSAAASREGQPSATFAHQREAIEDAPLASGRDARRALREARMSDPNANPGGRRERRGL